MSYLINWSDKDKSEMRSQGIKTVMICNECGWLISEPRECDKKCPECGNYYNNTDSKMERL